MIFVTVGTDHHPFDRLVEAIDSMKAKNLLPQGIFMQIGTSRVEPKFCDYDRFITFDSLMEKVTEARVIVTHGGPGSIMPVIYRGKIPVVMPRQKKYGEAVDDHQVDFSRRLEQKGRIILAETTSELGEKIISYDECLAGLPTDESHAKSPEERVSFFSQALENLSAELLRKK